MSCRCCGVGMNEVHSLVCVHAPVPDTFEGLQSQPASEHEPTPGVRPPTLREVLQRALDSEVISAEIEVAGQTMSIETALTTLSSDVLDRPTYPSGVGRESDGTGVIAVVAPEHGAT